MISIGAKAMATTLSTLSYVSYAASDADNSPLQKTFSVTTRALLAVALMLVWPSESNWRSDGMPRAEAAEISVPACTDKNILDQLLYNMFTLLKQQALKANPNDEQAKKWAASIENIRQLSNDSGTRICKADLIYDSLPTLAPWSVPASVKMQQAGCLWANMTYDGHAVVSFVYKLETLLDKPDQIHFEWTCVH
jgi:hypothetical protein